MQFHKWKVTLNYVYSPFKKKKIFIFQNPFFMQLLKGQDNLSKILRGGRKNTKSQEKILYKL